MYCNSDYGWYSTYDYCRIRCAYYCNRLYDYGCGCGYACGYDYGCGYYC